MRQADPDSEDPGSGVWPSKLIIRYTDGTISGEFFREAPHEYARHLSMIIIVDSARVEVSRSGQLEWRKYREGARVGQAP
jgi:hypothetical protein